MLPRGKYENPKRKVLKEVSDLIRKLRSEEFAMLMVTYAIYANMQILHKLAHLT